jgi:hypothetical protein
MKEVKLTPGEIEVLKEKTRPVWDKEKTRPVWDKMAGKVYSRELLDEILGSLEEYRSKDVH